MLSAPMNHATGLKLLIADDHAAMREMLRGMLSPLAAEIAVASDGEQAVCLFAQHAPDWTIMDLAMPHVDGLTATRQIIARNPAAKVVVLTQYRGAEYEQAAREAGACAFVSKENLNSLLA